MEKEKRGEAPSVEARLESATLSNPDVDCSGESRTTACLSATNPVAAPSFRPAFPVDTSPQLARMLAAYARTGRAQNVSFRKLVPWLKVGERFTHYAHSYPAKLLPHIAHYFLASDLFAGPDATVLDPFGGTGTVALETILSGRSALYSDVNPLAALIANVKTTPLNAERIEAAFARLTRRFRYRSSPDTEPDVVNLRYWYDDDTIRTLARIKQAVRGERDVQLRRFFEVSFSSCARKVSHADPRLSVPVKRKRGCEATERSNDAWTIFVDQVRANVRRMAELSSEISPSLPPKARYCGNDARNLREPSESLEVSGCPMRDGSVDLVITSPPYAGAQKYIRASSLSLGWLGLVGVSHLKTLEGASIGREHFPRSVDAQLPATGISGADRLIKRIARINKTRALIVSSYLVEMSQAIGEIARVLKPNGHFILVIGNNEVCGLPFRSSEYLIPIAGRFGLDVCLRLVDEIKSRGLMTKRNRGASVITREWVVVFKKPKIPSATAQGAQNAVL